PTAELPAIPAQETRSSQEARAGARIAPAPLRTIAAHGAMLDSMPENSVRQDDPVQQTPRQDDPGRRTAAPAEPAGTGSRTPRSGRGGVLLGTAACLLVVLLAVLALNTQSGRDRQTADGSGIPATTTTPPSAAAAPPPAPPAPAELEQTVRAYYGLLPEDARQAWEFLGETERAKAGFSDYLDFWNGIDDVRIRGPVQVQGSTVLVNLQFDPEEGRRTLERYQLTMSTTPDGRALIESASVIGSSSEDDDRGGRGNQAGDRDRQGDGDG
ncbi:MAG: hypothetical protein ACRDRM_10730, partial [Pseudonocardiaceae bacterium]